MARLFDPKVASTSQIIEASGSKHDELLGVHFVATASLIRAGHSGEFGDFEAVLQTQAHGWTLELLAPDEGSANLPALLHAHRGDIEAAFRRMTGEASAILPDIERRRFVVRVIPEGLDYDDAWISLSLSERGRRPLQCAFAGPKSAADLGAWADRLAVFLAHEATHSYCWFHAAEVRKAFSDEVVAYTVQRCVADRLSHGGKPPVPEHFREMAKQADDEPPSAFYRRYHSRLPDSLIAQFVANSLYDGQAGTKSAAGPLTSYCRHIAHSSIDFETVDDVAPILELRR
jgi:hypothetical protein